MMIFFLKSTPPQRHLQHLAQSSVLFSMRQILLATF